MDILSRITKKSDLKINDSLSAFDNMECQQTYGAFQVFHEFIMEIKPKRILEIGTSIGGFTNFLNKISKEENLNFDILSYDINEFPWYKNLIDDGIDLRIEDVFNWNSDTVKDDVIDFIQSEGITLVLCDGGNKIEEFKILSKYIKKGDFIMAHDYARDEKKFLDDINLKFWNWHEIQESDISNACETNGLEYYNQEKFDDIVWVCKKKTKDVVQTKNLNENSEITLVTGLWDLGRGGLTEGWSRSYEHYLEKFSQLLDVKENLIIYGDEELEKFVWSKRDKSNTQFILRKLEWFKTNEYYGKIQEIRNNPEWFNLSGWLKDSTQSKLEMYNPLVMSKVFLLNDAKIMDKFNSKNLFWIDAGLSNTVHPGYFTHDKVLNKLSNKIKKFTFICFPYKAENEIHGFKYPEINTWAESDVKLVARGGFFGGPKDSITDINNIYYRLLISTLDRGLMGTEESIFSIMTYKHPELIDYYEILDNGLISYFFENLKNEKVEIKKTKQVKDSNLFNIDNTALYVIGFNSPNQFETLITSMLEYDKDFIEKPKKYLLNNSTDNSTFEKYQQLCDLHNFTMINPGNNLGICGGRQYIAEHFESTGLDFYFFFEDDMFFYSGEENACRNGFNRKIKNLYTKSLEITNLENFDYLKLNFSEFFGDNSVQWAWYNVPQHIREKFWPNKTKLPELGLDPNAPRTKFNSIKSHKDVPYADGEIYYCNWPQVVTKEGNKKMFLNTKWAHPYEQTWMSFMYQELKENKLNFGILLSTPTEHNRFEHYGPGMRKES
jgi:hypothetical protein